MNFIFKAEVYHESRINFTNEGIPGNTSKEFEDGIEFEGIIQRPIKGYYNIEKKTGNIEGEQVKKLMQE